MNFTPPQVDPHIPSPLPKRKDGRSQQQGRSPSPWLAFLSALKPGNSFVVDWPTSQTVLKYAKELGLSVRAREELPRQEITALAQRRIWIVESNPPNTF